MATTFGVSPSEYPFREGALFIGEDEQGNPLGIVTNRHAITTGASRAGKGVGVINTNLRTWPHNVLVIDPKGEAANVSWKARAALGQNVYVLDPFDAANEVPDKYKVSYNPLADLDPDGLTIIEDIETIVDGIVMRSGHSGDVTWDDGGAELIAGLIAFALHSLPPDECNLLSVRRILTERSKGGLFDTVIDEMAKAEGDSLADVMRNGASHALAKEGKYYISAAVKHTKFLSTKGMGRVLGSSSFSMRDLKLKKTSLFVCLPFEMLKERQHGRFLRLVVRCGLGAMQQRTPDGKDIGERCLFILDEFFSLGYIDEIATGMGGFAGYGLHLWPFLQDIGQLRDRYGDKKAGTFFGNADLHQFFGNTDEPTLNFISQKIGNFTVDDLPDEPQWQGFDESNQLEVPIGLGSGDLTRSTIEHNRRMREFDLQEHRDRVARFQTDASRILGKPRLAPDQVAQLVRLEEGAPTANAQIAFVRGGRPMVCKLSRYFEWKNDQIPTAKRIATTQESKPFRSFITTKDGREIDRDSMKGVVQGKERHGQKGTVFATCYMGCGLKEFTGEKNWKLYATGDDAHQPCSHCGSPSGIKFWDQKTGEYRKLCYLSSKPLRRFWAGVG